MDECNSPGNHVEHLLSVLEGVCGSILEPEENTDENVYTLARKGENEWRCCCSKVRYWGSCFLYLLPPLGDIENLKRHLDNFVDINKRDLIGGSGRSISIRFSTHRSFDRIVWLNIPFGVGAQKGHLYFNKRGSSSCRLNSPPKYGPWFSDGRIRSNIQNSIDPKFRLRNYFLGFNAFHLNRLPSRIK